MFIALFRALPAPPDARIVFQETSRSGCFDGAYARGLWAAGFAFEVLPEAAVFSNTLPPLTEECRAGVPAQMNAYGTFLQVMQTL